MESKLAAAVITCITSVVGIVAMWLPPVMAQIHESIGEVGEYVQLGISGLLAIVTVLALTLIWRIILMQNETNREISKNNRATMEKVSDDNLEGNRLIAAAIDRDMVATDRCCNENRDILREALNLQKSQKVQDGRLSKHDKQISDLEDHSDMEHG